MNPGVRQLLLGGFQQWRSTLPAIRSFVTANYNQANPHNQAAMGVPPTITVSTTQPAGLTSEYRYTSGGSAIQFTGGRNQLFAVYRQFPVATLASSGGNTGAGTQAITWRAGATITAAKVGIRLLGSAVQYRFIVNGQYVSTTGTLTSTTSGTNYIQLDFGSSATRDIWVEGEFGQAMDGFALAPGDVIAAFTAPKRAIFLGDSFTESTGCTRGGDGYARVVGDMLAFNDCWTSGVGSTGYVATASGTRYNLGQRLTDATATGPWDVIFVAMGLNDAGGTAGAIFNEASADLNALRKAFPAAQIFVIGPWDVNAPGAPAAGYSAAKAEIQAAIGNTGAMFIDMEGVSYTKADATHPNTAGHSTLGLSVALKVKTALGA